MSNKYYLSQIYTFIATFFLVFFNCKSFAQSSKIFGKNEDKFLRLKSRAVYIYSSLAKNYPKYFFPYEKVPTNKKKLVKKICRSLIDRGFKNSDCVSISNVVADYDPNINNLPKLINFYEENKSKYKKILKKQLELIKVVKNDIETVSFMSSLNNRNLSIEQEKSSFAKELSQQIKKDNSLMVLSSDYLLQMLYSGHYNITEIDIVNSIQYILKKVDSYLKSYREGSKSSVLEENIFCAWEKKDSISYLVLVAMHKMVTSVDKDVLGLIKKIDNVNIIFLLLQKKYQLALWELRKLQFFNQADKLERYIVGKVFASDNLVDIRLLGMGFNNTLKTFFISGHSGVLKPHVSFNKNPAVYYSSNYRAEIAAYEFDKILNLNMVPLTHLAKYRDYKNGSQQYFVKNAYRSRDVTELGSSSPGKFSTSIGRAAKTKDIRFFDWLINNYDRNADNYLFLPNGQIVLVDHGFSFVDVGVIDFFKAKKKKFTKIIPSAHIIKNLININNDASLLDPLTPFLKNKQINKIKAKVAAFVKFYQKTNNDKT